MTYEVKKTENGMEYKPLLAENVDDIMIKSPEPLSPIQLDLIFDKILKLGSKGSVDIVDKDKKVLFTVEFTNLNTPWGKDDETDNTRTNS